MIYLSNAFSCQMIPEGVSCTVASSSRDEAAKLLLGDYYDGNGEFINCVSAFVGTSVVGHADVAAVIAKALGCPGMIDVNRVSIVLEKDDVLFVAQYIGPRLPEGAKVLPEGATIRWFKAKLLSPA